MTLARSYQHTHRSKSEIVCLVERKDRKMNSLTHNTRRLLSSKAFWLQLAGSICICLFEIGLTDTSEWYIISLIAFVNGARMYIAIETPLLAEKDSFEAENIEEQLKTLNTLNVIYMVLVIFLNPIFRYFEWPGDFATSTYLLLLFGIGVFASRSVQQLNARRNASEAQSKSENEKQARIESDLRKTISELNEKVAEKDKQLQTHSPEVIAGYQVEISRLTKKAEISAKVKGKSEKWDEISKLLNKPILRNNRYSKVVMRNGELEIVPCTADGTIKKKANERTTQQNENKERRQKIKLVA